MIVGRAAGETAAPQRIGACRVAARGSRSSRGASWRVAGGAKIGDEVVRIGAVCHPCRAAVGTVLGRPHARPMTRAAGGEPLPARPPSSASLPRSTRRGQRPNSLYRRRRARRSGSPISTASSCSSISGRPGAQPCLREMPSLDRLQAKLGDRLAIARGLRGPRRRQVVDAVLAKLGLDTVKIYLDPKSAVGQGLRGARPADQLSDRRAKARIRGRSKARRSGIRRRCWRYSNAHLSRDAGQGAASRPHEHAARTRRRAASPASSIDVADAGAGQCLDRHAGRLERRSTASGTPADGTTGSSVP